MSRQRRTFSPQFKAQVVLDLLTGEKTLAALCQEHQVSASLLETWKSTATARLADLFQTSSAPPESAARVQQLEQLVGQLTLEKELLKKASTLRRSGTSRNGRSS